MDSIFNTTYRSILVQPETTDQSIDGLWHKAVTQPNFLNGSLGAIPAVQLLIFNDRVVSFAGFLSGVGIILDCLGRGIGFTETEYAIGFHQ